MKILFFILILAVSNHAKAGEVPLYLAFVLHMHQPIYYPGMAIDSNYFNMPTDAGSNVTVGQVFEDAGFCYVRPATIINQNPEAKLTVHWTGSLITQIEWLSKNGFSSKGTSLSGIWDDYRKAINSNRMEMIIGGYHHPIYPLITKTDADLHYWKMFETYISYFPGKPRGFFPPEMAFDMSVIPWLKNFNLNWTLFDSFHIRGLPNKDKWSKEYCEYAFRPHVSGANGGIIIIPREHWLGQNQSDGFDPNYLVQELKKIHKWNTDPSKPFLVVIVSDGENGWMRQAGGGYYDWFWPGLLKAIKQKKNNFIKLTTVSEYLEKVYTPKDFIEINRGSWGVGGANTDLSTWEASQLDKEMWARINAVRTELQKRQSHVPPDKMAIAWDFFAMAETSCYWFWDSKSWAEKSYKALELALLYASENPPHFMKEPTQLPDFLISEF